MVDGAFFGSILGFRPDDDVNTPEPPVGYGFGQPMRLLTKVVPLLDIQLGLAGDDGQIHVAVSLMVATGSGAKQDNALGRQGAADGLSNSLNNFGVMANRIRLSMRR
jgi:hypothetical protein